jgi:hypothetical protein
MITKYRTQGTREYRFTRHSFVFASRGAAKLGGKHGMILRVDIVGNVLERLQDWASTVSNAIGLSLFVGGKAYSDNPINEQNRCWSHGNRLRLGRLRT